jgi:hypothetical protein
VDPIFPAAPVGSNEATGARARELCQAGLAAGVNVRVVGAARKLSFHPFASSRKRPTCAGALRR